MPSRRSVLLGGLLSLWGAIGPAWARVACRTGDETGPICRAELDFDRFLQHAYDTQHASQWCWAACISMVFAFYGHPVRQERIVRDAYGGIYDLPSGSGLKIASELDRSWTDDRGNRFRSRLRALFDAHAGRESIDNAMVVEALARGRPLIVGARDHTVVLTAVDYVPAPEGPDLLAAGVFDPWPGIGPRDLAEDEMTPLAEGGSLGFVALPEVS